MKLPTLYKKTNTGAIQFWTISVEQGCGPAGSEMRGIIVTEYGQLGTDSPQRTEDEISKGKNTGKKNATTAVQQAEAEAQAKWEKQKKKGYVESIESAQAGELDALIEGGIEPMLAHSYMDVVYDMRPGHENDPPQLIKTKDAKKIKFPVYMQPKLDGIRCVAILKDGVCTLWSRTRKPINSVPHIARAIEASFKEDIVLDGELYNHLYKNDFEKIVSAVRKDEPSESSGLVQYHIYDTINDKSQQERVEMLEKLRLEQPLIVVKTLGVIEQDVLDFFNDFRKQGYEGAMLRNTQAGYVNKRSYDLQKFKEFMEDDFEIVGINEGRGKLAGHVGAFVLKLKTANSTENGTVDVKLEGDTDYLKKCFEDHSLWKGKQLTVVYQGHTVDMSLRFPVGKAIRDYE